MTDKLNVILEPRSAMKFVVNLLRKLPASLTFGIVGEHIIVVVFEVGVGGLRCRFVRRDGPRKPWANFKATNWVSTVAQFFNTEYNKEFDKEFAVAQTVRGATTAWRGSFGRQLRAAPNSARQISFRPSSRSEIKLRSIPTCRPCRPVSIAVACGEHEYAFQIDRCRREPSCLARSLRSL